jgi:predicted KAP-like P-loop ATPase
MSTHSESAPEVEHPFSSDRPISSRTEDLLNRGSFAESLATAIHGWRQKDSLVIGLFGPWGEGKTSVKNLVVEAVGKLRKQSPPLIGDFNPWQWTGHEELAGAFFEQIGIVLGRIDHSADGRKRAAKWRAYAAYLRVGSMALGPWRSGVTYALAFIVAIGGSATFLATQSPALKIVVVALTVLVAVLLWAGNVADAIASAAAARVEAHQLTLSERKEELAKLLSALSEPVLVVIDDIDRLPPEQIKSVFQLVKANADFPNLVYLLMFQRSLVEEGIDPPGSGHEFLEKIIQVGFDIPTADRSRLEAVLFAGLDDILGEGRVAERFDQQRWGNVFVAGLRPYFENLRNVHRFLATLSFHVGLLRTRESLEVNPVDLTALEVLRLFEPKIYEDLASAKSLFTTRRGQLGRDDEETRRAINSIVDHGATDRRSYVQEILKQLFPPVSWVWGGPEHAAGIVEDWIRDLRICAAPIFDRYFQFAIPSGDISQADLDGILSATSNRERLAAYLRSLNERSLLVVALDRLEAYKERIAIGHAPAFITGLLDVGDELPPGSGRPFEMDADTHAARIIHWYLMQEADVKRREEILKQAFRDTAGLLLPVRLTYLEERIAAPDVSCVSPEGLEELKKLCLAKISAAAASSTLRSHSERAFILYRWLQWSGNDEPKQWVKGLIATDDGLLLFLEPFIREVRIRGLEDYVPRVRPQLTDLKDLEPFISRDELARRIQSISVEGRSETELRTISAVKEALEGRRHRR